MVKITINDQRFSVQEGITIIEAARQNGVDIPVLGYDPRLSPPNGVELSTVELLDGDGVRFVSATSTAVAPGMNIRTESPALSSFRQIYLQSLLRDHYGDCVAPCVARCPAGVDIQRYMYHAAAGNFAEALAVIKESNPLPSVCGRICPHPCEAECRRNAAEGAVNINAVKRFLADWDRFQLLPYQPHCAEDSGRKVAVIGSGPGGLTAAYFLRRKGHDVTIFEMRSNAGGMLRWGVPRYRLPDEVLDAEVQSILDLGVKIQYHQKLGRDFTLDSLKATGYDAVFLGIGAQGSTRLGIEGEDLPGVMSGIDLLTTVTLRRQPRLGDHVVVVGGGNTAIDAARTAVRLGCRSVTIVYRRTREEMPALASEIEEAIEEGVQMELLASPTVITQGEKGLELHCVRMQLGDLDASGRRRPVPIPDSDFVIPCTTVISAIGHVVEGEGISPDLALSRRGAIEVDAATMQTNLPGVFAGGDCQTGPDIAVEAIGAGKRAAEAIDEYLRSGQVTPQPARYTCTKGRWDEIPAEELRDLHPGGRNPIRMVDPEERKVNFMEVSDTWDAATAMREASRCLGCGCSERYDCIVRTYASRYDVQFKKNGQHRRLPVDDRHPILVRDPGKCVMCGLCLKACREMEGSAALTYHDHDGTLTIGPVDHRPLDKTTCVSCGHCVTVCPTGALTFKPVVPAVYRALNNPQLTVVAQIAPAVRAALAQHYGLSGEEAMGRLCAGLKAMGFAYVFDTCWAADLTIMEEGTEFLGRMAKGGTLPQFTSCCPAWINYCEKVAPDLLPHLSSCKSPQQMFGSVIKDYFAAQIGLRPERVFGVSIMPCNAKKYESRRAEFTHDGLPDVDAVITTNEIIEMFEEKGIDPLSLKPAELDTPFGNVSGAGIIFGASGGVAEAALRLAAERIMDKRLDAVDYHQVRGLKGIKEATVTLNGITVRLAVVSGLQNAQVLIDRIRAGDAPYDLIEVMACPGGCINGSGNPAPRLSTDREERLEVLYRLDRISPIKKSQDNPAVQEIYSNWLGEPTGEKSHHALHTTYGRRSMRVEPSVEDLLEEQDVVDLAVCVSTSCYMKGSWQVLEGLAAELRKRGLSNRFRVRARFCANNCGNGPSVTIGEHKVVHVDPDGVEAFVDELVVPEGS